MDSGTDNDIHLLSSLNVDESKLASDTILRDDEEVSKELSAGTYYIVVDTYTGSDRDYPGKYTIEVSFDAVQNSDSEGENPDVSVDNEVNDVDVTSSTTGNASIRGFAYNKTTGIGNIEGNRIEGAKCTLDNQNTSDQYNLTTDATGLFKFLEIISGTYDFEIIKDGFVTAKKEVIVGDSEIKWLSTGLDLVNQVFEQGAVHGYVYNSSEDGGPVAENMVEGALCKLYDDNDKEIMTVVSEPSGLFVFEKIPYGDYTIKITASGSDGNQKELSVVDTETITLNLGILINASDDDNLVNDDSEDITDTSDIDVLGSPDSDSSSPIVPSSFNDSSDDSGCSCSIVF